MNGQGENPGMSTVVLSVSWDNWDQGLNGQGVNPGMSTVVLSVSQLGPGIEWAGGESWDVHSCPECKLIGTTGTRD